MNLMLSQTKNIPDEQILLMFAENNLEAWEHLYDKYAPTMYGIIFSLSDDRTLAEDIFKEEFLQLKEKRILSGISHLLCSFLLRYTHTFARQQLKERGIDYSENPIVEASITNTLCSQHIREPLITPVFGFLCLD